jgi:ATP-dependent DNA helicase RecG
VHTQPRLNPSAAPPLTALHGVGESLAARLATLGVQSVTDLLFVLPLRYEDRTRISPIGALLAGQRAVVEGEVLLADISFRGRRQLLVRISDTTGTLTLRFFYFSNAQREGLQRGARLRCYGELRRGPLGLEMVHPEYRRLAVPPEPLSQTLTPVYPMTEGVTQGRLRALVQRALAMLPQQPLADLLPRDALPWPEKYSLESALRFLHQPPVGASLFELAAGRHPAQRRLAFEELLAHQLSLVELRRATRSEPAAALHDDHGLQRRLLEALPFALTSAQQRVSLEIDQDLQRERPMSRLVQGDVGCGKTAVAALAAARALGSGSQVALMAPTELLAEQHARSFARWFEALGVPVLLLTGSLRAAARRAVLQRIAREPVCIVIGTHALFQETVEFKSLALTIVDEQHRFGVQQRLSLRQKGHAAARIPHQLIMTATPIPRTLAMTAYADLDVSIIDELPPGRTPVRTVVIPEERRSEVVQRIRDTCLQGRQVYWVCALIEESEELHYQAAEESAATLTEALPELRVGLIHGRMKTQEKAAVMRAFTANEIQLLVATTVIEVGVDVPNATVVVIENAERMGLAQLHQLRGRTGRGRRDSACVLLYRGPLSEVARNRLAAIRDSNDGFEIAQRDLELRGPGELLGTRQAGLAQLRVADLLRDADMLADVRAASRRVQAEHPDTIAPLIARWIGARERFGNVG